MIIRISGGNDGVAEYLEKGRKAERELSRDELDHRVILDGNLDATNKIIQSIDNKDQERYLHITLSFHENDISHEVLKSITHEYKTLLMKAYADDEYSFYAEAHLPKVKHISNNLTGELVERKPHIHIVIPEVNLVTGKKLLPTGKVTFTEKYLDAIQEHLNYKYKLVSPKDTARVSDNNFANVLSRTKGDLYREKNADVKKQIIDGVHDGNITSLESFSHYLSKFGEVKTRNSGKENQYFAVRAKGDSKFTNLKSPLFSKQYIEKREIPLTKPTEKKVATLVSEWENRVSHEVKHIYPKSDSVRKAYKTLSADEKVNFLNERINRYELENKLSTKRGRQERSKRCVKQLTLPSSSRRANRLSYMPKCSLVYGIRGSSRTPEGERSITRRETSERILSFDEYSDLGKSGAKSIHVNQTMRWDDAGERSEFKRGIKPISDSSVLHEEYFVYLESQAQESEIDTMREVRNNIDAERFLSFLARDFQIVAADYKISHSQNGSPRFQVGNRNMNASDFLTKHMNLPWLESKTILLKVYAEQQANLPFDKALVRRTLTKNQAKERFESFNETKKELKSLLRINRSALFDEIKEMRSGIKEVYGHEREVARGLIVYHKLTGLEAIKELDRKGRNFLTDYHAIWSEDKDPLKAMQMLQEIINSQLDKNNTSISNAETIPSAAIDLHENSLQGLNTAPHEPNALTIPLLISEYATLAHSEGLEFFVRDIEEEVASKGMSYSEVKNYLDNEIELMRSIKADMSHDNDNVQE
ncbi:relaxase/mobilization nuclease domain-containing protein [Salmonella enterica]|nr:relaxase/mobilization nuclease domain-containing protein [Salmonella enterica]